MTDGIYYLPIGLTTSQIDLIEVLLSIHAHSLQLECEKRYLGVKEESNNDAIKVDDASKTSINGGKYPIIPQKRMTYMLDANVRAIANHPSLLVDHYIPRQFLRMEPTEISINSSDKFQKLNTILSLLIQRDRKQFPRPLKVCLISHSIKELDLIEGLVLGKYFKIKRFSGTPLYDEKYTLPVESYEDQMGSLTPTSSTSSTSSSTTSLYGRGSRSSNRLNDTMSGMLTSTANSRGSQISSVINNATTNITTTSTTSNTSNNISNNTSNNSNSNSTNSTNASGSPNDSDNKTNATDNTSTYTGYSKDTYHYSRKTKKSLYPDVFIDDWLFLTTTRHLTHDPNLLDNINVDLIICFDPLLDTNLPGVKSIRNRSLEGNVVPLIKLVVCNSPDHYMLEKTLLKNPELNAKNKVRDDKLNEEELEYVNTVDALLHFLLSRHKHYKSGDTSQIKSDIDYKLLLTNLLNGRSCGDDIPAIPIETHDFANEFHINKEIFEPRLSKLNHANSELKICNQVFDIKSYQSTLMKRTVDRLQDLEYEKEENSQMLSKKRLHSTEVQNELDFLKNEIGQVFKRFKDDEKIMIDSEKRLERANTETSKLKQRVQLLEKNQKQLRDILDLTSEDAIEEQIKLVTEDIRVTQDNASQLRERNKKSYDENEGLRSQYQLDSTAAAESARVLEALKKELEEAQKLLNGPAPKLKPHALEVEDMRLERQLTKIREKNKYLKQYIELMESQYSLKTNGAVPGSTTGGRTSNNSTRHRSTRSATPSYT
ncbi:HDA1 complex subunit 2 [Nakaseomyces bracarensis]|uniref:HDA1 complex subunit 2 n=1 Tax=Nakaseomyces bracarensis TaxID=273131 RepID=A0ABR4NS62_9SACH